MGVATALSVFALLVSVAPASAQVRADNGKHLGWYKNGKADKANKRAARLGVPQDRVVVDGNGAVIDRSRTRRSGNVNGNLGRWTPPAGYTYRNGYYYDRNGTCVYDNRGQRVNAYRNTYPQYRQNNGYYGNGYPNNNYGYYGNGNNGYYGNGGANYGYYDNREGDKDREDVARAASQNGYYAGFQRGQYDASRRDNANPYGHGAYQFGYDGFDPSWGSASTYQQYYRQYFIQGYQDGYNQRGYTRSFPRRRF